MPTPDHGLAAHVCTVAVRPNDFDWTGQLNSSVFLELCEVGRWQWALANALDLRNHRLAAVVTSVDLRYLRPVSWDPVAEVRVRTALHDLTFYGITLSQQVENEEGEVVATAVVKLALYDFENRRPRRIRLSELAR